MSLKSSGFERPEKDDGSVSRCWEIKNCDQANCPAFQRADIPCWRMLNTLCQQGHAPEIDNQWHQCLICPVFEKNAESDPRGWNYFLLDELVHLFNKDIGTPDLQKEKSLAEVLDKLPYGLITVDKNRKINYFNPTAERITGLAATSVTGRLCRDVFERSSNEVDLRFRKVVRTGENIYNHEHAILAANGDTIPIICSTTALKDHQGNIIGAMEVFKDIKTRKDLEESLRFSESKYRRIFEGSKDMIFITSKDGRFKDVNFAGVDLLGYANKQELLSLVSAEKIYHNPRHWKVFQKQIDLYGYIKDYEARFKKKDGTLVHCLLSGNAVRSSEGDIQGYEGIVKDITARMDAVRKLQQRHQELLLLNSVALAINTAGDLDDLLMIALKEILQVLNLSSGAIFLVDHESADFSLRARQGLNGQINTDTSQIIIHDDDLMRALLKKNLLLRPEPTFPPFKADLKLNESANPIPLTCFLITAKEKASGFLAFQVSEGRDFTNRDLHLLGSIGNFLGGAIENARLHQTIHQHREQLKGLTAQLFHTQEMERRRIARELHDEAGQALTGINFTLETIEKELSPQPGRIKEHVSGIKKQINRTYHEMRRISYRLHPALLADLGLEPALETYLSDVAKHSELNIDFKMVGFGARLDPETETVLYRLSQEATTNTLKHSEAKNFKLSIIKSYPHIIFLAEDDGIGFNPGNFNEHKQQALGLVSMRERVAMLGGRFSLRSSKDKGTRIRIEIPLKESSG